MVETKNKKRGNRKGKGAKKANSSEGNQILEEAEKTKLPPVQTPVETEIVQEETEDVVKATPVQNPVETVQEETTLRDMVTPMKKEGVREDLEFTVRELKEAHEVSERGMQQHIERVEAARDRLRNQRDEALNEADELKQQLEDAIEQTRIEYEEKLQKQNSELIATSNRLEQMAAMLAATEAKTANLENDEEKFFSQISAAEIKAQTAVRERDALAQQIAQIQANSEEAASIERAERQVVEKKLAQVQAMQLEAQNEREALEAQLKAITIEATTSMNYSSELEQIKSAARSELISDLATRGFDALEKSEESAILERLNHHFEERLQNEKHALQTAAQIQTQLAVDAANAATEAQVREQLLAKLKKKVHDAKEQSDAQICTALSERDDAIKKLHDLQANQQQAHLNTAQLEEARAQIVALETKLAAELETADANLAIATAQTAEQTETQVRESLLSKLKKKVHDAKHERSQEFEALTMRLHELETEKSTYTAQIESQTSALQDARAQLTASQARVAELDNIIKDTSLAQDSAQIAALAAAQQEIQDLQQRLSQNEANSKSAAEYASAAEQELNNLRPLVQEIEALKSKLAEKESQMKALEEAQGATENATINELQSQVVAHVSRIKLLESAADAAAAEKEELIIALEEAKYHVQKNSTEFAEKLQKQKAQHEEALATLRKEAEDERENALDEAAAENLEATAAAIKKRERELENLHAVALEEMEEALATETQELFAKAETKHREEVAALQKHLNDTNTKFTSSEHHCAELEAQIKQLEKQAQEQRRHFDREFATQAETLQFRHRAELEQAILQAKWQVGDSTKNRDVSDGTSAQLREELNTLQASAAIEKRALETQLNELQHELDQQRDHNHALATRLGVLTCDSEIIRHSATTCFTRVSNRVVTGAENLYEVVQPRLADITAQVLARANNLHTNGGSSSSDS